MVAEADALASGRPAAARLPPMCDERDPAGPTRRELAVGAASLAILPMIPMVGCAGNAKKFEAKRVEAKDGFVELDTKDYPDLVTPGGMVALEPSGQKKPVLVMRIENDRFRVLSLECTHLGCTLRWDDTTQGLACACHGSRFDDAGRVLEGPAKRSLDEYPSQLSGTRLQFKLPT
jgi:Rieske Fe-S protein